MWSPSGSVSRSYRLRRKPARRPGAAESPPSRRPTELRLKRRRCREAVRYRGERGTCARGMELAAKPRPTIPVRDGKVSADALIGTPDGSRVTSSANETFLVLRPSYAELVLNLPRQAQVIYPKDVASILVWGDVFPDATVVEAGVG